MENKKYLDKVVSHLVKGTTIKYDDVRVYVTLFLLQSKPKVFVSLYQNLSNMKFLNSYDIPEISASYYCRHLFGLTYDEIEYVWNSYITIIKDKIYNRET